jgi:hypothetical protein
VIILAFDVPIENRNTRARINFFISITSNFFRESGGYGICAQIGQVQIRKNCFC